MQENRGWERVERGQVEISVNSSVRKWASSFSSTGCSHRARQTDNLNSSLVVAASTKFSLLFLHLLFTQFFDEQVDEQSSP